MDILDTELAGTSSSEEIIGQEGANNSKSTAGYF